MGILKHTIILTQLIVVTIISSPTDMLAMVANTETRCKIMEITINNISKPQQPTETARSIQSWTKQSLRLHSQVLFHQMPPPQLPYPPKTIINKFSKNI
jgi:hypothetical protein